MHNTYLTDIAQGSTTVVYDLLDAPGCLYRPSPVHQKWAASCSPSRWVLSGKVMEKAQAGHHVLPHSGWEIAAGVLVGRPLGNFFSEETSQMESPT
jgi:hypothetical protein